MTSICIVQESIFFKTHSNKCSIEPGISFLLFPGTNHLRQKLASAFSAMQFHQFLLPPAGQSLRLRDSAFIISSLVKRKF